MSKFPSTLVFHKLADGANTRYSLMQGDFASNALEKWLGVIRRGEYVQAQGDPAWAFEPLQSMWSDESPLAEDSDEDELGNDQLPPMEIDSDNDDVGVRADAHAPPSANPSTLSPLSKSDSRALRCLGRVITDLTDNLVIVHVK